MTDPDEMQARLAALVQGRAAMRTLLVSLRDGYIKGKDIRPAIEAVIGSGTDLNDQAPESAALEERRRLIGEVQAWRNAYYQASRDADAMSMLVRLVTLVEGSLVTTGPSTISAEVWREIQDALQRSTERLELEKIQIEFIDEDSARSDS